MKAVDPQTFVKRLKFILLSHKIEEYVPENQLQQMLENVISVAYEEGFFDLKYLDIYLTREYKLPPEKVTEILRDIQSIQEKLEEVFLAVDYLASKKIGALIAIEKEIPLKAYTDRGTKIDASLSKDLLVNIFFPHSPLHDGAVIIQNNRISAAGCLLPLPPTHNLDPDFLARTRHLAAIGLSQETDAAVVVVSEETGTISLATRGNLERELDREELKDRLLNYLRTR